LGENARLKHQVSSYWHFIKDNTLPFVSVIIPYHNCASTIKDCLESVLAQSIHFIEVLCIDNNSCDGTNAIVQEFAQRDGRVKYLKEQEQGAGFARNAGIAAAKGIFIAFIDADDHYPSNDVLAKLFEGAINNGQKVCGGEVEFFGDTEGHVNTYNFERFDLPVKGRTVRYSEYQEFFFYQRFIYHHSLLKEGGIRFPPYLRYQDPPFFIQVMVAVGSFWALPMLSYSYRTKPVRIPKSDAEVRDTVRGVIDVMSVAKSQQLGIIQERLYRFFDYKIGMKEPIIAQLKKYDTDMASLMACAVRAADIELLQRAGVFFGREHLFVELPGILRNLAERNNSPLDGNQKSRWVKDADEIEQTWWENVKPNGENGET
jgi:glycosyltransferase involved in cell wall biosynthesis